MAKVAGTQAPAAAAAEASSATANARVLRTITLDTPIR
jgi:hypothetical protein